MENTKFYVLGRVYCINEAGAEIKIALIDDNNNLIYVIVPRNNCNPRKWSSDDYVKIEGDICGIECSESQEITEYRFSKAVLKRILSKNSINEKIDYCGKFSFYGEIINVGVVNENHYVLRFKTDDGIYNIHTDRYTLFHNIINIDLTKKYKLNGVVSFITYRRFEFEGVVSQINFAANQINFA